MVVLDAVLFQQERGDIETDEPSPT